MKNNYKYIIVNGCSFTCGINSDNFPLVNKYNAKFYNISKQGGSLQRIVRTTLDWISKNPKKINDTLFVLGITSIERFELFNNKSNSWAPMNHWYGDIKIRHSDDKSKNQNSTLIGWSVEERNNYFYNFYNDNAIFYSAIKDIITLQTLFKLNNIDYVMFDSLEPLDSYWKRWCDDKEDKFGYKTLYDNFVNKNYWFKHKKYDSMLQFTKNNSEMRVSKTDYHPNDKAHTYWGENLIKFIEEKNETTI
tara:strand:+ start:15 stop:758 length:744 start_codon:yes stop_codon:yes gene_type:complete